MLSSLSLGPEPPSITTAGHGPLPVGTVRMPGSSKGGAPTCTSSDWNFPESMYDGAGAGAVSAGAGALMKYNPEISPVSPSTLTCAANPDGRSKFSVAITTSFRPKV